MFVRLAIEVWGIGLGGTKMEVGSGVGEWGKWCGATGFYDPCVWVYFCCSVGCLCQELQEVGVV
jgi:hypothetical protein